MITHNYTIIHLKTEKNQVFFPGTKNGAKNMASIPIDFERVFTKFAFSFTCILF